MSSVGTAARKGLCSMRPTRLSNAPMVMRKFSLYVTSSLPSSPPRRYPEMHWWILATCPSTEAPSASASAPPPHQQRPKLP
eukprot:4621949-Prymnesium_polylepis.1